jgi:hypothetical protein
MATNDKRDEVTIDTWQPRMPAEPPRSRTFVGISRNVTGLEPLFGLTTYTVPDDAPKPSLLVQAVVERGSKTLHGDIILAVEPAWREIAKMLEKDPSLVFQIEPRKWEEIIAGAYKAAGFDDSGPFDSSIK